MIKPTELKPCPIDIFEQEIIRQCDDGSDVSIHPELASALLDQLRATPAQPSAGIEAAAEMCDNQMWDVRIKTSFRFESNRDMDVYARACSDLRDKIRAMPMPDATNVGNKKERSELWHMAYNARGWLKHDDDCLMGLPTGHATDCPCNCSQKKTEEELGRLIAATLTLPDTVSIDGKGGDFQISAIEVRAVQFLEKHAVDHILDNTPLPEGISISSHSSHPKNRTVSSYTAECKKAAITYESEGCRVFPTDWVVSYSPDHLEIYTDEAFKTKFTASQSSNTAMKLELAAAGRNVMELQKFTGKQVQEIKDEANTASLAVIKGLVRHVAHEKHPRMCLLLVDSINKCTCGLDEALAIATAHLERLNDDTSK